MNKLLVINASQPDLRFSLFSGETLQEIASGVVSGIGRARSAFNAQDLFKKTISAKIFPAA
jgi:acetate kinase